MLQSLRIRNLALLETAELEFSGGFTAITGETGAGKSVLLGALNLLAGGRADKSLIRAGSDRLEVQAILELPNTQTVDALLEANDLPPCEDSQLILRRTLERERSGRAQVNGVTIPLAQLREIGELWIDFHGPGEAQKLFNERWQRTLLDAFARLEAPLAAYRKDYRQWRTLLQQIDALRNGERLSEEEQTFLQQQIEAIDTANLSEETVMELEHESRRAENAEDLLRLADSLAGALLGKDIEGKLSKLLPEAQKLGRLDSDCVNLAERLEGLIIEMRDLGSEFSHVAHSVDFDEQTLRDIRQRMEQWLELRRKYGPTLEGILDKRNAMAERLAQQSDIEGSLHRLEKQTAQIEATLCQQAAKLTAARRSAAQSLTAETVPLLQRLGFKQSHLDICVQDEGKLSEHGDSSCRFLFAPNKGVDPMPLSKIASSGEIARVLLALKTVLARADATPLLVFDEVDANIGGEIAVQVGRMLADLGQCHQVYCVTHLPQVAGQAQEHFVVQKSETGDSTYVSISSIHEDADARISELARMLGDRQASSARQHAQELLKRGPLADSPRTSA